MAKQKTGCHENVWRPILEIGLMVAPGEGVRSLVQSRDGFPTRENGLVQGEENALSVEVHRRQPVALPDDIRWQAVATDAVEPPGYHDFLQPVHRDEAVDQGYLKVVSDGTRL